MGWSDESEIESKEGEDSQQDVGEQDRDSGNSSMSDDIDLSGLAPSAMGVDEAAEMEHTWTSMVWADPGMGKSHYCYTMPEPVCFIDTENKADDIAHKFTDKQIHIWQPSVFDEAVQARDEALSLLSEYKSQADKQGTLVVDSMADIWEWSQHKYIEKWYPDTPPDQVDLQLQDWPKIKDYHNKQFRKGIEDCDFHVGWTTTRKDDVGSAIENDLDHTPDKPGGETNNSYKVNSIIRLYQGSDGVPVGDLQKSGLVRFKYLGLKRPTFEKHKELVEHIEEIEADGAETVADVEQAYDLDYAVSFTEANTMRFIENE